MASARLNAQANELAKAYHLFGHGRRPGRNAGAQERPALAEGPPEQTLRQAVKDPGAGKREA
jgi:hypothetical protein